MVEHYRKTEPLNPTAYLYDRFWNRLDTTDPKACWEWPGALRAGYGAIKHQGKVFSAHRVAYILTYDEPLQHFVVAHKCDNPKCCNPEHLEAIPHWRNVKDGIDRLGRKSRDGANCVQSKAMSK